MKLIKTAAARRGTRLALMTGGVRSPACLATATEERNNRLLNTKTLPTTCPGCGGQGNGNHVFWECTEVKKRATEAERPRSPTDQLQQRCAWPAATETGVHNEQVIKWMEATTKFIWDCRYGRTETKCTREAAIKSKQRQKNESIADLEKIVTEEDFDHARHDEEVDRREDSADERDSKDIDPETLDPEVMDRQDKQNTVDQDSTPAKSRRDQQSSMLQKEQQCKRRRVSGHTTSTVLTEPPTRPDTEQRQPDWNPASTKRRWTKLTLDTQEQGIQPCKKRKTEVS